MNAAAVVMLSKSPAIDSCKTRLTNRLTPDQANELQDALIQDTWAHIAPEQGYHLWVAAPSFESLTYFRPLTHRLLIQQGIHLGHKMRHVTTTLFSMGYSQVILIGSDMPLMTRCLLSEAMEKLHTANCVLGPAEDGGYYLIGLTPQTPDPFASIPWGTSQVLAKTLQHLKTAPSPYALLTRNRDIDTWADLLFYTESPNLTPAIPHLLSWAQQHVGVLAHTQSP